MDYEVERLMRWQRRSKQIALILATLSFLAAVALIVALLLR